MPLPTFTIPRPNREAKPEELRGWSYMQQQLELKPFTPVLTSFTGTAPTENLGYFQLLGPVVFYFIRLRSTDVFGWNSGATVSLPHPCFVPTDGDEFPQFGFPAVDTTLRTSVNNEHPKIGKGLLTMYTPLSSTGGPTEVVFQGFYLRNGHVITQAGGG